MTWACPSISVPENHRKENSRAGRKEKEWQGGKSFFWMNPDRKASCRTGYALGTETTGRKLWRF